MNPKLASEIVEGAAQGQLPILLVGAPGVGKTAIVRQAAKACKMQYRCLYLTDLDPVDLGGLPIPVGECVERRLDSDLAQYVDPKCPPTIILLDELGQASPAMQAAAAKLIWARELAGKPLAPAVSVMAATNRASDRAGAGPLLSHLVSRFASIIHIEADLDIWQDWARKTRIDASVRSLLAWRPNLLMQFDSAAGAALKAYACPRSWERASQLCALRLSEDSLTHALAGAVGDGPAAELMAHKRLVESKLDLDSIMRGGKIAIPKDPALRYALSIGVAMRIKTEKDMARALEISEVLVETAPEFAVLLIRESTAWDGWMGSEAVCKAVKNNKIMEIINDL